MLLIPLPPHAVVPSMQGHQLLGEGALCQSLPLGMMPTRPLQACSIMTGEAGSPHGLPVGGCKASKAAQQMPVAVATLGLNITQTRIPHISILATGIWSASKSE